MRITPARLVALGTTFVFVIAVRTLDAIGVEDATRVGFVAAVIAIILTWAFAS
ncbi:hypothetical protein MKK75_14570 [Methylobacterium sp. J-030]|uniref:hypothetical protein n=1 Tax=Methylobacterium sp. J-030 TaxID=2836627 RepID=UPI001FB96C90|nr:hypothetical protein [Methylobacterium sp. J-030]MCJ2070005.1 hypothetical protein [Methylobacterium sp. J-030]